MSLNPNVSPKVIAALQPLYSDPDFTGVTDMNVSVTSTPVVPAPEVDQVDVTPALPA